MAALSAFILYAALIAFTLFLAKKKNWKQTLEYLGVFCKKFSLSQTVVESILLFVSMFFLLAVELFVFSLFNLDDSQNVAVVISQLSIFAIIVVATIGPFAEELFFRGFLQKHIGVILSSLVFALLHFSFGSIVEVAGAFTASLVLGYWVRYRSKNLWPAIIAHALYNIVSMAFVLVVQ
ncbi:MAG: type II CAAX endopeptidase family protein [Candidatus Micrarchaeota archaeon]